MTKNKLYPCEICNRKTKIRSRIKTGKYKDKMACRYCKITKEPKKDMYEGYFEYHIKQLYRNPFSELSNKHIKYPTKLNIAHLWPKRIYKSVSNTVENCIYLTWQEHTDMDRLLDEMRIEEFKQLFPIAYVRMVNLLPEVTERGRLYFEIKNSIKN